jgi:hypothetical protein
MVHQKNTISEEVASLRSRYFNQNISESFRSDLCQKIVASFRERQLTLHTTHLSYRTLSHWDSLGLINCERDEKKGWRRFNLIERLWVEIIFTLRKLGLSLDQIRLVKPFFFKKISEKAWLTYAEYYCLSAYLFERPTRLIILDEGQAEFLDYSESKKLDSLSTVGNYISLNLNSLLSEILSNSLKVESGLQKNLADYQLEICEVMECEDFDFLKIHKKQNKIESYEFQKSFSPSVPDSEIKKRYKDYEISEKVVNGKMSSRTRTVRKKI